MFCCIAQRPVPPIAYVLQLSALTSLSVLVSNGGCACLRASTALVSGSLVGCCYARLPHFGSICPIIGHCPPSCLQELHVSSCQPGGFAVLTSLGRLARLTLVWSSYLPACLSQLTGLEHLYLSDAGRSLNSDEAVAAVNEALQHLTGVSVCELAATAMLLEGCTCFVERLLCCTDLFAHHPIPPLLLAADFLVRGRRTTAQPASSRTGRAEPLAALLPGHCTL